MITSMNLPPPKNIIKMANLEPMPSSTGSFPSFCDPREQSTKASRSTFWWPLKCSHSTSGWHHHIPQRDISSHRYPVLVPHQVLAVPHYAAKILDILLHKFITNGLWSCFHQLLHDHIICVSHTNPVFKHSGHDPVSLAVMHIRNRLYPCKVLFFEWLPSLGKRSA